MAAVIAVISAALALTVGRLVKSLNEPIYDRAYDLRRSTGGTDSPVVIVAANDDSLRRLAAGRMHWSWPCPRQFWGLSAQYVQKCGAKAVAFDLLFPEPSVYDKEFDDDATFATALDGVTIPVVQATLVGHDGSLGPYTPRPARPPIFGAVNLTDAGTVRDYLSTVHGIPSLAVQVVRAAGFKLPEWAGENFRLHYYGPHEDAHGPTFPYVAAADLFDTLDPDSPHKNLIDPAVFKGKIVLFGATATGASDLKSAPVGAIYPGVEIHATAIENLLRYQRVKVVPAAGLALVTLLAAGGAAAGTSVPRRTWLKLLLSGLVATLLLVVAAVLFRMDTIIWLPPVSPLIAVGLSVVLSLSWSYFAEDRQARFFLKALSQYLSPQVASELKANPGKLAISTEKGELTILFSDIVSFTDLSERLDERVGPLLNFYLDEMSQPVFANNGTLDKYIGDAIMSFWNAPLAQADHAVRACQTALAMQKRLAEIQPQLTELGVPGMAARIGINTGICAFGNMGSRAKFNYSVIGDACNFASRLEGVNKIYGTHALIGETTAKLVRDQFILRKVDVMRAKGKQKPLAIFELIGEGKPDAATASLIARYEAAFARYCARDWDAAERILLEILSANPLDGPSRTLLSRISLFRHDPPNEVWDGVFVALEK